MGNVKLTGKGSSADQGLGEFFKYCYVLLQNKSYAEEQILNTEEMNVFYKNLVKDSILQMVFQLTKML